MTRPITGGTGAWSGIPGGQWPSQDARGRVQFPPPSRSQSQLDSHHAPAGDSAPASGLHLLQAAGSHLLGAGQAPDTGPVTPGRLVADGHSVCRGLLRPLAGEGLVAFTRDKAPARGLVAALEPGQVALVMLGDSAIGLGVEEMPLEALPGLLRQRLRKFGDLEASPACGASFRHGGVPARWALGLDAGQWTAADRSWLGRLADEFRLGVQDLPQGVWVVDQLGGLHPHWPADVRFEPLHA